MRVETAILDLQRMNPDAEIKLHHKSGEKVLFINSLANDDSVVWLETESDCDMGEEIATRLEKLQDEPAYRIYMGMLQSGITVDMVRKYVGDEDANRMQIFIDERRNEVSEQFKDLPDDLLLVKSFVAGLQCAFAEIAEERSGMRFEDFFEQMCDEHCEKIEKF